MTIPSLCRPCSKGITGTPFRLLLARPVDMFPHTEHVETVALFERCTPEEAEFAAVRRRRLKEQARANASSSTATPLLLEVIEEEDKAP